MEQMRFGKTFFLRIKVKRQQLDTLVTNILLKRSPCIFLRFISDSDWNLCLMLCNRNT